MLAGEGQVGEDLGFSVSTQGSSRGTCRLEVLQEPEPPLLGRLPGWAELEPTPSCNAVAGELGPTDVRSY